MGGLTQETEKLPTIINQKQMPTFFHFILKKYRKNVPENIKWILSSIKIKIHKGNNLKILTTKIENPNCAYKPISREKYCNSM